MNPLIDPQGQPIAAYLLRILTTMVKKAGGELKIDALDMLDSLDGEGLVRHYDPVQKQLVIRLAPIGSEAYFLRGGEVRQISARTYQSQSIPPQQPTLTRASESPLDEIEQRIEPPIVSRQRQSTVLSDERLYELEQQRERERLSRQAERIVLDFPENPQAQPRPTRPTSPSPGLRTRSEPLRRVQPSQPADSPGLQEQFLKR